MSDRTKTILILAAVTAVLIGWDVYVWQSPGSGDTISEVVLGWAKKTVVLPFAFGFLMGHLFWPQRPLE